MGELYKLTFGNGKSYVGISDSSSRRRLIEHRSRAAAGVKTALYHAWRKYGEPHLSILAFLETDMLPQTEIDAIVSLKTMTPHGYNTSSGGDISPMKNPLVAAKCCGANSPMKRADVRAKISGIKSAMKRPEVRAKISNAIRKLISLGAYNNPMKDPVVAKRYGAIRSAQMLTLGDTHPSKRPEVRSKISLNNGMRRQDVRAKVSATLKGRARPDLAGVNSTMRRHPELRQRLSEAMKNKPWSEARRLAQQRRHAIM